MIGLNFHLLDKWIQYSHNSHETQCLEWYNNNNIGKWREILIDCWWYIYPSGQKSPYVGHV